MAGSFGRLNMTNLLKQFIWLLLGFISAYCWLVLLLAF